MSRGFSIKVYPKELTLKMFYNSGKESTRATIKGGCECEIIKFIFLSLSQVRNFLPPQSAEPEIFLLEQDGVYTGTYGAKNGKPRKLTKTFL